MSKIEELMREYREEFNEEFPLFYVSDKNESEIVKIIKKAIANGEPYALEIEKGVVY
jgi:hypothetical protein